MPDPSSVFNPDDGEELSFSSHPAPTPAAPTPAAPAGERKIAADVLFPKLGPDLVKRLEDQLPTPRMTQGGIHAVMQACTHAYTNMMYEMTPNISIPETLYVQGTIERELEKDNIVPSEAADIARRLQTELYNYIIEQQERASDSYNANIAPTAPYERLRQRDMYPALSTNPWEDAKAVTKYLQLPPAASERFTRDYVAYVREIHKQHVATAKLMPLIFSVPADRADTSNRIAEAHEQSEALMEKMLATLVASDSPVLPQGEARESKTRQFLVHTLHSPAPIDPVRPKTRLDEASDYSFIMGIREQLDANPDVRTRFDNHVALLQNIADNVLDPNKISQYANTLIHKHGRELASTLQQAGIENSREVGARIANIFTKQVNLVQSNGPDTHGKT